MVFLFKVGLRYSYPARPSILGCNKFHSFILRMAMKIVLSDNTRLNVYILSSSLADLGILLLMIFYGCLTQKKKKKDPTRYFEVPFRNTIPVSRPSTSERPVLKNSHSSKILWTESEVQSLRLQFLRQRVFFFHPVSSSVSWNPRQIQ